MALLQDDSYRAELLSDLQADYTKFFTMAERELEGISKTKPVDQYVRLQKIGQGTFGEVFKVRHKSTKQHFALKRIRMEQEKEGVCSTFNIPILKFPITALREIRILQSLNHENIVCLKEICHSPRKPISTSRYSQRMLVMDSNHNSILFLSFVIMILLV